VYQVLRKLRSALFPGVYEKYPIEENDINIIIGNNIRSAALELKSLIERVLIDECGEKEVQQGTCHKCRERANEITIHLLEQLPKIRELLHKDIEAAYRGDPAAKAVRKYC